MYVVRRGSVELVTGDRLMDVHGRRARCSASSRCFTVVPLGFVARAAEDTLVYRIPAAADTAGARAPGRGALRRAVHEQARPAARRIANTSRRLSPAGRPVRELIRAAPLVCEPATTVQDAARRMVDAGVTCAVVDLGDQLGIVTDRDIRERVVAAGSAPDTPLSEVMSAPAWTVAGDRTGTEALLEMLDHGVRHLPVLDAGRRLIGVLDDVDLMASERRAPFRLRAEIARSPDARGRRRGRHPSCPRPVIALHDAELPVAAISRAIASVHDSATRRLIDLAHADLGPPPVPYTWLATGSFGRFEPFPSSDVDSALAWDGPDDDIELRGWMHRLAEHVLADLSASGFAADAKGAVASNPLFARSIEAWEEAARTWVEHPDRDRGLMLLCVAVESDPVWGSRRPRRAPVRGVRPQPRTAELLLRRLAQAALAVRPPDGLPAPPGAPLERRAEGARHQEGGPAADRVAGALERPGRRRGRGHDARTDRRRRSRPERCRGEDAAVLRDAFELVCELRMEHQVDQLRRGEAPDNLIDPSGLTPLTRTALKEAFRAVAAHPAGRRAAARARRRW